MLHEQRHFWENICEVKVDIHKQFLVSGLIKNFSYLKLFSNTVSLFLPFRYGG